MIKNSHHHIVDLALILSTLLIFGVGCIFSSLAAEYSYVKWNTNPIVSEAQYKAALATLKPTGPQSQDLNAIVARELNQPQWFPYSVHGEISWPRLTIYLCLTGVVTVLYFVFLRKAIHTLFFKKKR